MPARCGLDIEVPDRKLYLPKLNGEYAAKTSTPGPMMSGLSRSVDARSGPREEKDATNGAGAPVEPTPAVSDAVDAAPFAAMYAFTNAASVWLMCTVGTA